MDILVLAVVGLIVALAAGYVVKEKKRGVKCIGCPAAGNCASCTGCSCCSTENG